MAEELAELAEPAPQKGIPALVRANEAGTMYHLGIEWHSESGPPIFTDRIAWVPIDPELARDLGLVDRSDILLVPKPKS